MPSKSPAQARLMAMAAHNPKAAKRAGVPQKVAKDFNTADAGTGILKPPKQKHPGVLGEAMRKAHNTKRMDVVRAHKGKA